MSERLLIGVALSIATLTVVTFTALFVLGAAMKSKTSRPPGRAATHRCATHATIAPPPQ